MFNRTRESSNHLFIANPKLYTETATNEILLVLAAA